MARIKLEVRNNAVNTRISTGQLAKEIRQVYESDYSQAESLIETYLEGRCKGLSIGERLTLLEKLSAEFDEVNHGVYESRDQEKEMLSKIFSLLLGKKISQIDLSSAELMERLSESLNTIFDTLNQLVKVIDMTLLGDQTGEETIRQIIGFHLEGEARPKSLESYLGQISKVFLIAQQSFKKTAHSKVNEILHELDPDQIRATSGGRLRFGPLRKAELFKIYEEKFSVCKKWFDSGRFMEEFSREFERNCQKLSVQ